MVKSIVSIVLTCFSIIRSRNVKYNKGFTVMYVFGATLSSKVYKALEHLKELLQLEYLLYFCVEFCLGISEKNTLIVLVRIN